MTDDTRNEETTEEETDDTQVMIEKLKADLAATEKSLTAANRESAGRRKKIDALESKIAEHDEAQMSELEKARAEAEEARKEAQTERDNAREVLLRAAFVSEAAKQGVAHPEDAFALADKSGVEIDEDGNVAGVADAVKTLVDSGRIVLSGKTPAPKTDAGAGGGDRPGQSQKLSPLEAGIASAMHLSPEAYLKQKAEIEQKAQERAVQGEE